MLWEMKIHHSLLEPMTWKTVKHPQITRLRYIRTSATYFSFQNHIYDIKKKVENTKPERERERERGRALCYIPYNIHIYTYIRIVSSSSSSSLPSSSSCMHLLLGPFFSSDL
ncbi:hypothetical protein YC2023_074303 [Brassica napus]